MTLFKIATSLNRSRIIVRAYFVDRSYCQFNISCNSFGMVMGYRFSDLIHKKVSKYKYSEKSNILYLYYED